MLGPAFEVGEGLEDHYLEVLGGAEVSDFAGGLGEAVVVIFFDVTEEVDVGEGDEIFEGELDACEACFGYGIELGEEGSA